MTQVLSALPAAVNLLLYKGDDFTMTLTVTNPDGSAASLTGATFKAQIRTAPGAATLLASFTTSVATNVVTLMLPNASSATLPAACAWDCQMTATAGTITTLAAGTVSVSGDVSV